ncbi:unnamed protein product [Mytilus coruscus]|uniref:Reverse transcriptase domain-containing protein n=1 Tax=Mytilus coruscus TaxID=42192 RepID=A0A6J8B9E3_MYTCO|nr:unnamed protein product [Mytilus coruscus]
MSTSQIDYILHNATIAFLSDYKIHDQCHSNTSSHVPVSAKMNVKSKPTNKAIKSSYVSKFKIQWKDIDSETYHNHISNELSQHNIESHSIEESINFLCNCLKNPMIMDNYRGIAVTPIISKLFECTILPRLTVNFNQSSLQFGFTKGLSMLMASLIITEARAEVKLVTIEPLFLITVDSQKVFDVVDHIILLDALYDHTQKHPLWSIVKNLYSGLVSRVKCKATISDSFNIHQGVRQGGILSPFLYKVYVNNLLDDLKSHSLGLKIGTNYVGCPTCADDIAFLSSSHQVLQCMLSVATHHARQSRVTINPTKTKAVILNKPKNINRSDLNWTLGNTPVYSSEDTTHLGLIRAELKENNLNSKFTVKIKMETTVKLAIQDYWTKTVIKEIETKSSLTYLDKTLLRIGSTHPVWTSLSSTVSNVKKGAIKVRLLTGTYFLESHRSKFSGGRESALCKCCGTSDEDIIHAVL